MMKPELQLFESNPIIAAVTDEEQLEEALASDCDILFFLCGSICSIGRNTRFADRRA